MAKNHHKVLGIAADAGKSEIKSAYRKLVKECHPDHAGGDCGKFRDIQEAYISMMESEDQRRHQPSDPEPIVRRSGTRRPHPFPFRGEPEPLIPEREATFTNRTTGRSEPLMRQSEEDLFDWVFRRFFL